MNKTIFITGTSSGLGRATVEYFAGKGWNVAATMRRMSAANIFAAHKNVKVFELEMTDFDAIDRVAKQAIDTFGKVDVLVNNAGYYQMGPLETSTMAQIRAQFETNVFALIAMTQAFIPHFSANKSGSIINLSSISAENGYPFTSVYAASKAAVASLTESLNVELDGLGIQAKAIFPGTHATKIFTKIDMAGSVPKPYAPLMKQFFSAQAEAMGSKPDVVAKVIYEAVTDGKKNKVRYFAGPDATFIPSAKRLLGQDGYFGFIKNAVLKGPSPLLRPFMRQGDAKVETDLSDLTKATE